MPRARQGKIARLPRVLREVVNHRLLDGQTAEEICGWLNAQPKARAVLDRHFAGVDVSPQNLSEWRAGGYADWLRQHEREETVRELAAYADRLRQAGGGTFAQGAGAVATGHILAVLEAVADGTAEEGTDPGAVILALARLRKLEIESEKLALVARREDREQERLALDKEKFQRETAKLFLRWYDDQETKRIAAEGGDEETRVGELIRHWFGDMPDNIGPEPLR